MEETMSLLSEAMESCTMIDHTTVDDGYGSPKRVWSDGAPFMAAIVLDTSVEARTASIAGVTDLYTVTTRKDVNLQYHDVFRREADGKIFRVTSDGDDNKTPQSAVLDMRQVNAEEWKLG